MIVPACNELEKPFLVNGTRWLYVWDTEEKRHGYLNMETDIVEWDSNFHPANPPHFRSRIRGDNHE